MRSFRECVIEQLSNVEYAKTYIEVAFKQYEKDKDLAALTQAISDVESGLRRLCLAIS